jgi:hypothetical protein
VLIRHVLERATGLVLDLIGGPLLNLDFPASPSASPPPTFGLFMINHLFIDSSS